MQKDRVGLGWRPELAAGIFSSLDQIDVLEVVCSTGGQIGRRERQTLRLLARQAPVHIHGVDLGLAGAEPVHAKRLDRLARLIHDVEPEAWSEHLAFVRAGGHEIGHLATPPRSEASAENAARNLRKAAGLIGAQPAMENIATLIQPPCSPLPEPEWMAQIAHLSGCDLLLDLHNLYANSVNFKFDPLQFLGELPLERVRTIHIAGGRWITSPDGKGQYLLDDHLHAVTGPVYELLAEVAARVEQPLTVILERDGRYPEMPLLLQELEKARQALRIGRQRATMADTGVEPKEAHDGAEPSSQDRIEKFLARLYVDRQQRERFLRDPLATAKASGLSEWECAEVAKISPQELERAADSFDRKREVKKRHRRLGNVRRLLRWIKSF